MSDNGNIKNVVKELEDIKYALNQSSIVAITNQRGTILHVNQKLCHISKYRKEELIGQDHRILNSNYHSRAFFKNMWKTIGTGHTWRGEIRNQTKDGNYYWVDTTIVPFLNEKGKPYQYISIRNDITARKKMEEELKENKEMYQLITENSSDLLATINHEGIIQYTSLSHKKILDYNKDEMISQPILNYIHPEDKGLFQHSFESLTKMDGPLNIEYRLQKKNGTYRDVETKMTIVEFNNDEIIVLAMRDITKRKKSENMVRHLAFHDTLTDLPNRRYFMKHLRDEVIRSKSESKMFAVMFLDLDHFKQVNDSWGHETGDIILHKTAERLQSSVRKNDVIARLGGDEFTALLKDITSRDEVLEIIKRIRENFESPLEVTQRPITVSFSIGVAMYPGDGLDADLLLTRADTALYAVKESGRSGYDFFHKAMEEQSLERALLENELKKAMELEQFELDYQPKIDLANKTLIGVEALIRWRHPELGRIPPNKFIPLAEDTGLIIPIGYWVLKKACEQNKQWQDMGYDPINISVNISVKQLYDPNLLSDIKSILEETKLNGKWLTLEVTESVFTDVDDVKKILQNIRELGVDIAIDDFGTGYSSFTYIKDLPVDTLKIDASFIRDVHESEQSQAIVSAVLSLASTLGIKVVAEGVEIEEQLRYLDKDGCNFAQGFFFSKPIPSDQFESYLKEADVEEGRSHI